MSSPRTMRTCPTTPRTERTMTMSCVIRRQGIRRAGGRYADRAGVAELVRRARLKIGWPSGRAGSSPAPGIALLCRAAAASPYFAVYGATLGATPDRTAAHSLIGGLPVSMRSPESRRMRGQCCPDVRGKQRGESFGRGLRIKECHERCGSEAQRAYDVEPLVS